MKKFSSLEEIREEIDEVDIQILDFVILQRFSAIEKETSLLTAPNFDINFLSTPSSFIFASFEQEIIAELKKLDDPAIDVIEEETSPPVHDSAKETFIPFDSHFFLI